MSKRLILLLFCFIPIAAHSFKVVSYNVENLFDCEQDSICDDSEYTESGARHWTYHRYFHKREHIARTLVNIGEWEGIDLVGLCEVENARCLTDLCTQNLGNLPYSFIHFDSPDQRGIDVALLYRTDRFRVLNAYPIRVLTEPDERPTRDVLYTCGITGFGDTLHVYLCHLPSQLGGATSRAGLRTRVKYILAQHTDSVLRADAQARIIVMGDMNSAPEEDIAGMHNQMLSLEQNGQGTYKYQGLWSCIDQIYVSESLLSTAQTHIYAAPWLLTADEEYTGFCPLRTFQGYRYQPDGYSDHLPVVLTISPNQSNPIMATSLEYVLEDIYSQIAEDQGTAEQMDWETLQEELLQIHQQPIVLNERNYDALRELPFLSEEQVSRILLKVRDMPLHSAYELQLVGGLKDYEIRNLLPFVTVGTAEQNPFYWRELATMGRHEISLRTDVRNIESFSGTDPVYLQAKYGYTFRQKAAAGFTVRRPAGGVWKDLQYGGYVQLSEIGRLKRLVAGCYQARFGEGLVTNHFFHTGKSSQVMLVGSGREGLSKVSSASSDRYQGIGGTIRLGRHVETSGWYSVDENKVWHHAMGANIRCNFDRWRFGITVMEHLYSDSLPVRNTYYNSSYFRGKHQLVIGANLRYTWRWLQLFGEAAAAENNQWGFAGIAGMRIAPITDVGIIAMYRYYSPTFDNRFGYAFSESSRIGDEQGGYIGIEYKGLRRWRFSAYGDIFRFSGPKFGIRASGTMGYEVFGQAEYILPEHRCLIYMRSKQKGEVITNRGRLSYTYASGAWRFCSQADGTIVRQADGEKRLTYGVSVHQDIEYRVQAIPMVIQLRLQGFDVQDWVNRIYLYENDVLYAFSIPVTYGRGGRWYVNCRYAITDNLSLYARVSETIYHPLWATATSRPVSKTDIHILLRAHF